MYEKKILDAIQILIDNAIDKATFDKTIKGVVSKCVDEKNGKYVIIYQDSSFYAFSGDTSQTYKPGTSVYVLIPRNDMTQTKTILGSVDKLGTDYISTIETTDSYQPIGNSVISMDTEQSICSYASGGDLNILYNKTNPSSSLIDLDATAANTYIKQCNYLILGGNFRTALDKQQRYGGNYGLGFDLNFADNMTGETVKRTYLVNVNNMTGNPYLYTKVSEQKVVFNIDGENFIDIDKIYLYGYDFPNTISGKPDDIFVSGLIMTAADELEVNEQAGNKLAMIFPQGLYFDNNDSATATRKVETQVKIDNKIVNSDSSALKYYWFKENYSINSSSVLYNRYGGNCWECLNNKNIVETDVENNPTIVDWITNEDSIIITKSGIPARTTDYKCVAVYNNTLVFSKTFTIYNYSSNYEINIESDSGVQFSYDNGHPTLTCTVTPIGSYTYDWGMVDVTGTYTSIPVTTAANTAYIIALNRFNELQTGLANGTIILTAAIQTELNTLKSTLQDYDNKIMRVEGNTIYNLKLNMITNFATFVCTVYNNGTYVGKGKIKIENDLNTSDNSYTLVINHGDQVFKYSNDGISPCSKSLENPQELYPLSFVLYDEKGNEINDEVIKAKDVSWTVPTTDTMIKVSAVHGNPSKVDNVNETATYTEYKQFYFEIPVLYSSNKNRNTIELSVKYKNKIVIAKTELLFLKEGESGSNGTDFVCRIVPNVAANVLPPLYPTVTYDGSTATINYTPAAANVWFRAQLYHNGSEIFDAATSGNTTENKPITIKWEMLKNKYDTTHSDVSNFTVNLSTGVFTFDNLSSISDTTLKANPSNIVKCTLTYDGIDYVATMPIILVNVNNGGSTSYAVSLNDNTGFRYAMYTTDGRYPIYDNANPFSLKVIQTIEGTDQDISIATASGYAVDYTWSVKGLIYANNWVTQSNLILDTLRSRNLQRNEKYYKPIDEFNGLCLSNALYCEIKRSGSTLATIHIPIHMYLNRYGNAAMNGWDGNHIAIDEDGGFILAPQVGAGKKESDNSFTGVFMGSVAEAGASETETGLFGYNAGSRTLELNAKDGSAKFGKIGSGQIIIQPGEDKATIQSGDYEIIRTQASGKYLSGRVYYSKSGNVYTELVPGTDYTIGDNIVGSNIYVWSSGSGMEIDLNDPHIRFGSGKFRIDADGNVYADGYATIADLESGDIDIPGVENWKVEYATDRVQFETDSTLTPVDTNLTKTITGKCLYKDSYVSGYTVQLVDSSGTVISHDQATDGIGILTNVSGQVFTISFNAQSQYQWTDAVNNYYFKFSYTPIGGSVQTIIKQFSANAIIMAEDGRSITSATVTYQAGTDPSTPPSGEWVSNPPSVAQGNYLWTRTVINYSSGSPTTTYSVAYMGVNGSQGQSSYTYIRYSINSNGNPMVDTPTSSTKYIGVYSGTSSSVPSYTAFTWSKYVGADGTSITIKGSYNTITELTTAHPSGNTLGDAYVIDLNLYVYTNDAGGSGSLSGDWKDVGQFQGRDGIDGTSPYNVILTNESQTIAGGTSAAIATTITTNVIGYMGTTQMVTTVGTISGLPTGMTVAITNNNTTSPLITFTVTTSMTTKSGQVTIPVTINGVTINKIFSYSLSLTGATGQAGSAGAAAKLVTINPSSQIFKSTTGASGTFTPQYIYLYPSFQSVTYSKWQYSTDGTTWINVTSGSNSLTIGTYNSIANSLRIERTCNLYTSSVTAISFRCVSNDANIYDTTTIVKIYDVVDLSVGGRNLLIKTSNPKIATGTGGTNQTTTLYNFSSFYMDNYYDLTTVAGKSVKVTFSGDWETTATSGTIGVQLGGWPYTGFVGTITVNSSNQSGHLKGTATIAKNASYNTSYSNVMTRLDNLTGTVTFSNVKIELGDVATDWTIAPEDLATNQVLQYITTSTSTAPSSSAAGWGPSIPVSADNYVWQRLQTIYDNGTTENSSPVCIYTPAIQISSIEEQYFIHTSNTTAPPQDSTSWLNEKPEWRDEYYQAATRRYLWVRTKYTYTGNTSKVEYSIPYYDPTWETISLLNQSIIDNAQAVEDAINNGYVTIKDGYIEIRDTADSSKGILLSKEGISFKVNGNTYTSVWSLDGTFNAQSILVKNLNASNILSGTLTLKAANDATNGVFLLQNTNGNEVAKVDVNGLKVTAVDGSYVYLRTGEDNSSYKGIYLVDAGGNTFVSTSTTNGIFTVEKQVINDYQEFNGNIRIIRIGSRGIGFIGI